MNIRRLLADLRHAGMQRPAHSYGLAAISPSSAGARPRIYEARGHVPQIDASAMVHETAVLIGEVRIGPDCYIGPNSVCRGDQGSIRIGPGTSLQDCCVVHTRPQGRVVIGEFGQIGHGAMLHGCTIGRSVLIGMGAIVLDDAQIDDDAMVGAAALVTARQHVPARMLVQGIPGRVIREVTDAEISIKGDVAMRYVALARTRQGARRALPRVLEATDLTAEGTRASDARE